MPNVKLALHKFNIEDTKERSHKKKKLTYRDVMKAVTFYF